MIKPAKPQDTVHTVAQGLVAARYQACAFKHAVLDLRRSEFDGSMVGLP
jgi:hypothetical protein